MQFLPIAEVEKDTPPEKPTFSQGEILELVDMEGKEDVQEVCCGGPPPPKSNPFERPGYILQPYVRGFLIDDKVDVALVKTDLEISDHVGTLLARLGLTRDDYRVPPGLYGVGRPAADSPVLVTANYKLTFDSLRKELGGVDCWVLVLDTCGINVWCAAGKQTFSTDELIRSVEKTSLAEKVTHRRLIIPQLGATGVAAHTVKLKCGFRVHYGPVRASDLAKYLRDDMRATAEMRAVTFTLKERLELIPVEFYLFSKKIWWIFPLLFLLSGVGPAFFSFEQSWQRGLSGSGGLFFGGVSGAILMPVLLPWIPFRSFSVKGALLGLLMACLYVQFIAAPLLDNVAIILVFTMVSSYLSMNFTGSTPYTSPSGVEKEMKRAIPLQILALIMAGALWLISPFL